MKPSELRPALAHLIEVQQPAMLWGAPGVGKSDLGRQLAEDTERELRDVRLGQMDVVDVRGFPVPDLEKQVMKWLIADFLPPMKINGKPNKTRGILFLDELTSAPSAVQGTMYQLMLDRRIGEYILPENWTVMCAGNRKSDRSVVHEMPAALANRLCHLTFDVDADDWQNWALANGIHEHVRGFLRYRQNLLHNYDANAQAWPSPRIWEKVARHAIDKGLPASTERSIIQGWVGEGAALEFHTYRQVYAKLPEFDQIVKDPKNAPLPEGMDCKYAISTMIDSRITTKNIKPIMTYLERMEKEFQVVTLRGALLANQELYGQEDMTKWLMQNAAFITN